MQFYTIQLLPSLQRCIGALSIIGGDIAPLREGSRVSFSVNSGGSNGAKNASKNGTKTDGGDGDKTKGAGGSGGGEVVRGTVVKLEYVAISLPMRLRMKMKRSKRLVATVQTSPAAAAAAGLDRVSYTVDAATLTPVADADAIAALDASHSTAAVNMIVSSICEYLAHTNDDRAAAAAAADGDDAVVAFDDDDVDCDGGDGGDGSGFCTRFRGSRLRGSASFEALTVHVKHIASSNGGGGGGSGGSGSSSSSSSSDALERSDNRSVDDGVATAADVVSGADMAVHLRMRALRALSNLLMAR
jgi:hypothetical protein